MTALQGKSKKEKTENEETSSVKSHSPDSKSSKKSPQTMEDLLASTGYTLKGVKKGDVVEGTVMRVGRSEVTVDIGGKTEGVVIDRELENYRETLLSLSPGDTVVAQVIVAENDRGQSVLSLRRFIFDKRWTLLAEYQKSGEAVEIIFKEPVRGGILVDFGGLRGYVPQSQIDSTLSRQLDKLTGRKTLAKVVEADKETNRLVFSQRAIAEGEALAKQKDLLSAVTVDATVPATVTSVVPFGAFAKFSVEKDGEAHTVEGLIHISEIAWEKVDDPNQYLKAGETVKVKVIGVDPKTGKLTLSLKQLLPDPWEHVLDMFEKDTQVKGTVARVSPYGIFVTVSPGIEGLIHMSKLTPGEEPKSGQEITCIIEDIKPAERKMSLSLALKEKPIGYR